MVLRYLTIALFLAACGGETPTAKPDAPPKPAAVTPAPLAAATPPAPATDHAAHTPPADAAAFAQIAGPGKRIFFAELKDGAHVKSPLKINFGAEGVDIKPAGAPEPNSGHHHLVIDGAPIMAGAAVPKDDKNIHFGKGETSTEVTLTPGSHTLTLQLADFAHRSYGPALSSTITVVVE